MDKQEIIRAVWLALLAIVMIALIILAPVMRVPS